jgi:hypothetical protein
MTSFSGRCATVRSKTARGRQFADARDNLFDTVLVGEHLHVVAQVLDPAAVGIGH